MIRDIDEVIVVQRCVKILIQALINIPRILAFKKLRKYHLTA